LAGADFSYDEDLDTDDVLGEDVFDSDDDDLDSPAGFDSLAGFDSVAGFDEESVVPLVVGVAEDAVDSDSVLLGVLFLA
jgi:hypothetical protein